MDEHALVRILDLEHVLQRHREPFGDALEDAGGMQQAQGHRLAPRDECANPLGTGAKRPDHDAVPVGMGAEKRVRIGIVAGDEPLDLLRGAHPSLASRRRRSEATAIVTQSGRWSTS